MLLDKCKIVNAYLSSALSRFVCLVETAKMPSFDEQDW